METTQTIEVTGTDFSEVLAFSKFDTMGGTKILESVFITYEGTLVGNAGFENTSLTSASTSNVTLDADFLLSGPLGLNLGTSIDEQTEDVVLGIFDGTIDFDGTSGITANYTANAGDEQLFTDAMDVSFFNGPGMFDLIFNVEASSTANGGGNAIARIGTQAGAMVTVRYTYTMEEVQVSAPASLAIVGLGLLAFSRLRRS
jgi:hypothetical protein